MKKVSITILLVLPFILIYLISILGKVVAKYSHVYAEYVALFVDNERMDDMYSMYVDLDEYKEKEEPIKLDIRVMPEFANDRKYNVFNSNESVSVINTVKEGDDYVSYLTPLAEGYSRYTVVSDENNQLKYTFNIIVEEGELSSLHFMLKNGTGEYIDKLDLSTGKSRTVIMDYFPKSTKPIYKDVQFTSSNPAVATINEDGAITGISAGTSVITATSKEKPDVQAFLTVNVTNDSEEPAYFNYFGSNNLVISGNTFDFKVGKEGVAENNGKIILNKDGLTYADLMLKAASGVSNVTIDGLVVTFKQNGIYRLQLKPVANSQVVYDTINIQVTDII